MPLADSARENSPSYSLRDNEPMTMRTRRIVTRLLTLLALTASTQASATSTTSAPVRSAAYNRGLDAIFAKDWRKAYDIFLSLWTESKNSDKESDVAVNLGQTEVVLGKYRDAAEHLSFGIHLLPVEDADVKERAIKGLTYAKKRVGTLRISAPDGAEVFVDGKPIGIAPIVLETFVEPGSVKLSARHTSQGSGEVSLDIVAGEEKPIEIRLSDVPPKATVLPPQPPYTPAALNDPKGLMHASVTPIPESERRQGIEGKTIVLIVGGVATLAAAGTATYFGLKARSARNDAESMLREAESAFGPHPCTSVQDSSLCAGIRGKLNTRADTSKVYNVMLPAAGIAAVATGILYVAWPARKSTTAQSPTLIPIADQRGGGIMVQGNF